jgi:hypothetical protein
MWRLLLGAQQLSFERDELILIKCLRLPESREPFELINDA